ncbi:AL845275.1 [Phodopus roborovskii]|uniref:AL845275.1 protein n=1 Tax=Phodopus roborovskii TaxID=109678 RepID=A0AAU9ZQP6_PHORO|nr:AL845275.1 [Phodopus roborovskii]
METAPAFPRAARPGPRLRAAGPARFTGRQQSPLRPRRPPPSWRGQAAPAFPAARALLPHSRRARSRRAAGKAEPPPPPSPPPAPPQEARTVGRTAPRVCSRTTDGLEPLRCLTPGSRQQSRGCILHMGPNLAHCTRFSLQLRVCTGEVGW